ncbi:1-phosphatidylinositol 4,5-bisphosphate phosphodiesterase eta-2-like isoform X2 [Ornithodoros turicata]|uniref:1-phosphatidylinositol 4,5-bisphosphate phosphodiesterase eta-2-like isoform X2 n=1 Tax=Ornithodoros turicata TaxID=34597 RepID=UPI00313994E1
MAIDMERGSSFWRKRIVLEDASKDAAAIEEILEVLKKGMKLHKVRSSKRFYKRAFQLDLNNLRMGYKNSHKCGILASKPFIDLFDVEEVRKGWKTDVFNVVEGKFRRRKTYLPFSSLNVSEDTCFSLILAPKQNTLDLVAHTPNECDLWVRGLRHIVANCKTQRREQDYERWLKEQFQHADVNDNGSLNFNEIQGLLKQLNISMDKRYSRFLFNAANFKQNKVDGEDVLDPEEFVKFYYSLLSRPDIEKIFKQYTAPNMSIMGPEELQKFLLKEQKTEVSITECKQLVENFRRDKELPEGVLGLAGFRDILLSDDHDIFKKECRRVYQDMEQPLNHYYIASSHNTYLVQGQLVGNSSVEGYITALKKGCRCLELDVWDGPNDEPVVYHGYTLTSKILFRDILDAVKLYAFVESQYPVILSLENHCTIEQQKMMAKHLVDILGDLLHKTPVSDKEDKLPSPESLLNKVIVKGKKLNKDHTVDEDDSDEEGAPKHATPVAGGQLAEELSECVNYCKSAHFKTFLDTENWKFYEMASFSEVKASNICAIPAGAVEFVKYNSKHFSRIYPKGTRTDSSNYCPVPFWNVGCQIVALNYQSWDQKTFINEAKFSTNGRSGYVLMPEFLRNGTFDPNKIDPAMKRTLTVKIISGQQIPKPMAVAEGEVVDPYVIIKVKGHPLDNQKVKTKFIHNNGFNPYWGEIFELDIRVPELAMILFTVKDENRIGKNMKLGKYALPFTAIAEGYRHVHLRNEAFGPLVPASIFVHVTIRE